MATVYRRKGTKFFWAGFKAPNGNILYRSTKSTNKAEARKIAYGWEGAGSTILVENATAAQVDKVIRDVWERHSGKKMSVNKVDLFFSKWLTDKKIKAGTHTRYSQVIKDFLEGLGERSALDIKSISSADVQSYVNRCGERGVSGSTVLLGVKILRSAFRAAMKLGFLERDPSSSLEMPVAIAESKNPFTDEEIKQLLTASKGTDWEIFVMLAAFAGIRLADVVDLQWNNFDLLVGGVKFMPKKTSRKGVIVDVPIADSLLHYLKKRRDEVGLDAVHVAPTLEGRTSGGRKGLSIEFGKLVEAAKIDPLTIRPADGRKRSFSKKTTHSLRHSFVSKFTNAGVSKDVTAVFVGHSNPEQTKRYSHYDRDVLREALNTAFSVAAS